MKHEKEKTEVLLIDAKLCRYILDDNDISLQDFAQSCGRNTCYAVVAWLKKQKYLKTYQVQGLINLAGVDNFKNSIIKYELEKERR